MAYLPELEYLVSYELKALLKLYTMKKTYVFLGVLLLIAAGCNVKSDTSSVPEEDGFSFAFLTDIHLQPEKQAVEGFRLAIDTLNKLNPDFVITGGDLVMDVLDQSYGRADSLFTLYKEVSGELNMPVYNTVGNHEVYGWHREEEGIESDPEFGKKMFENRIGERYYSCLLYTSDAADDLVSV